MRLSIREVSEDRKGARIRRKIRDWVVSEDGKRMRTRQATGRTDIWREVSEDGM